MENVTFSYKDISEITSKSSDINEQFNAIAERIKIATSTDIYFCEIIGSRWSYCAGAKNLDVPEHRIQLTEKYGIMTGDISISENEWKNILKILKDFLPK